jgi:hypothetical protein
MLDNAGIRRLPLLAALAALTACGASAPATPPVAAAAPADPAAVARAAADANAARKTPEEAAAAAPDAKTCEAKVKPREMAFCYLKSEAEASIDPLFALGRTLAEKAVKQPVSYWPDFTYAAENAGVLAAKTKESRLYVGLGAAAEVDQLFAVRAIHHMLATLRYGHARGKEADEPVRKERLGAAHTACLGKLGAGNPMLASAAADCLKEIHDPADTVALVDAAMSQTDLEAQAHILEVAAPATPFPRPSLDKLVTVLEKPLGPKWTHGELFMRASICKVLLREVPATDPWPRKAAETAVREIGARNGQAKEPCEALAKRGK